MYPEDLDCPMCGGEGWYGGHLCEVCMGEGTARDDS